MSQAISSGMALVFAGCCHCHYLSDQNHVQSALKRYRDEAKPSYVQTETQTRQKISGSASQDSRQIREPSTSREQEDLRIVAVKKSAQQIDYNHLFDDEDDILAELDTLDAFAERASGPQDAAAIESEIARAPESTDLNDNDEDEAMLREMYG